MDTHIGENTCKKYFTTIHVNFVIKRFLRNYDWLFILLKNHKYVHFLFPYKLVYFY